MTSEPPLRRYEVRGPLIPLPPGLRSIDRLQLLREDRFNDSYCFLCGYDGNRAIVMLADGSLRAVRLHNLASYRPPAQSLAHDIPPRPTRPVPLARPLSPSEPQRRRADDSDNSDRSADADLSGLPLSSYGELRLALYDWPMEVADDRGQVCSLRISRLSQINEVKL